MGKNRKRINSALKALGISANGGIGRKDKNRMLEFKNLESSIENDKILLKSYTDKNSIIPKVVLKKYHSKVQLLESLKPYILPLIIKSKVGTQQTIDFKDDLPEDFPF